MKSRIFRHASIVASLLLLVAVPTQASPIKFADVVNVMGDLDKGGQASQLRLRVTQDPSVPLNARTNTSQSAGTSTTTSTDGSVVDASNALTTTENSNSSLVAGTDLAPQTPQGDVQVFDQDQVNGTICDCGEIPAVGGGFPKWPFLLLIPLVCVTGICTHHGHKIPPPECPTCPPCPNCPTPTPTPSVPEPTSLLLLGSGITALAAGARRRYAKMRAAKEESTMLEV
ncbi:MAG TPA: PEP-CTERM sorting domain-containing protein [Pyrinomonadaceae bacterium]|nr:PEP-CTERM sorting domain-containing protein [Pyrinomonadaceae bacterium]